MRAVGICVIAITALPAFAQPRVSIHWDSSPRTALTQRGAEQRQNQARYAAFSWQIGHAWQSQEVGRGSLQLRYIRRTVRVERLGRWVEGPRPHAMYTLSLASRWANSWHSAYETEVALCPALENASETTSGMGDVKLSGVGLVRRRATQHTIG